jgi:hypothetical protein
MGFSFVAAECIIEPTEWVELKLPSFVRIERALRFAKNIERILRFFFV